MLWTFTNTIFGRREAADVAVVVDCCVALSSYDTGLYAQTKENAARQRAPQRARRRPETQRASQHTSQSVRTADVPERMRSAASPRLFVLLALPLG
jgi:hypothetical protein